MRARRLDDGTFVIVTNETAPESSADRELLEQALSDSSMLIRSGSVPPRPCAPTADTGTIEERVEMDALDALTSVAWFNQYQLGVLVALVGGLQPSADTVAEVIGRAQDLDVASPAAIGAAATMVSLVRAGDAEALGSFLASALLHFDDDELHEGATALATSLTVTVAETLGIEATIVRTEMIDAVMGGPTRHDATTSCPTVNHRHQRPATRSSRRREMFRRCIVTPATSAAHRI